MLCAGIVRSAGELSGMYELTLEHFTFDNTLLNILKSWTVQSGQSSARNAAFLVGPYSNIRLSRYSSHDRPLGQRRRPTKALVRAVAGVSGHTRKRLLGGISRRGEREQV